MLYLTIILKCCNYKDTRSIELMKRYRIYSKPEVVPQIVSVGWSMSAFLFGGFWAIFHKLYRIGFGTIILLILFYIMIDGFEINEKMSELIEILFWTPHTFFIRF